MSENLTCDRCLNGDPWRCRGRGKCANAKTASSYGKRTSRASSRKEGTGSPRFVSPHDRGCAPEKSRSGGPVRSTRVVKPEFDTSAPMAEAIRQAIADGMSVDQVKWHLNGDQSPSARTISK